MLYDKISDSKEPPATQVALIDEQISGIAAALSHNTTPALPGLLSGDAGIALFFAYLIEAYPDGQYETATSAYLEKLSTAVEKQSSHNLSAGIAGIGFVFQHLRNIGLLDPLEDINLSALDEAIITRAEQDYSIGNWDPLHGLVGLGIYFLERHKETRETAYLEKIVDHLVTLRSITKTGSVWVTAGVPGYGKDNYNFGMAHGMPGVLSFLAKCYALGIRRAGIASILPSCLNFLLAHRNEKNELFVFPSSIDVSQAATEKDPQLRHSRNGWCYGDLGMAQALIHCGRTMSKPDWQKTGVDIALQSTMIPYGHSGCADASFCHGSIGLVHQYDRLFRTTNDIRFKKAASDWLDFTHANYYRPQCHPGGFAFRSYNKRSRQFGFIPSFGLLEGMAGIGLVLLSYHYPVPPAWDAIFQTDV
jgi:lantibiotic biosynthesis protein